MFIYGFKTLFLQKKCKFKTKMFKKWLLKIIQNKLRKGKLF